MRTFFIILFLGFVFCQLNPLNGIGYLGLTNNPLTYEKGQNIFDTSKLCNSPDNKWLIPCGMSANPILQTDITIESQSYSSNVDYTRDQYSDVKVDASASFDGFSAQGSYSSSTSTYINTITQTYTSLVTAYVELQLYNLDSNKITMPLSPELIKYIEILHDKVLTGDEAGYQEWFTQFGTNFKPGVTTTGISGARLEQMNWISNDYFHSTDITTVKNSASASFSYEKVFNAGGSDNWGVTTQQIEDFTSNRSTFTVQAVGGTMDPSMTVTEWEQSAYANPALLSYELDLSLFWLQPEVLCPYGNFSADIITKILNDYIDAYAPYLKVNSIYGCTNQYGKNFLLNYTVDDGSCDYDYPINSFFGDSYETVQVTAIKTGAVVSTSLVYANMFTGSSSCPIWSTPHCQTFTYPTMYETGALCMLYFKTQTCYFEMAHVTICLCEGVTTAGGPSFGAYYSSGLVNPFTNNYNCPTGFSQVNGFFCIGDSVPTVNYAGRFILLDGTCWLSNPYTASCNCPVNTTSNMYETVPYNDGISTSWVLNLYICMSPPTFLIGVNVGSRPSLIQANFNVGNSSYPSPSLPPSPSPSPSKHSNHKFDPSTSNIIFMVLLFLVSVLILVGCLTLCFWGYKRYNLGSYEPID